MIAPGPLVSIIIPVYNGANYLQEAIESALAQTWRNIEIIIVNDGSNDGGKTREVALSYGDRIRYFEKENGGVASALNLGIREMRGEYFSWLSHDDVYYPEKIANNLTFIRQFSEHVIVYSDFEEIDEKGDLIRTYHLNDIEHAKFRVSLVLKRAIHGCSLLIPRNCFDIVGVFDEVLMTSQDYDLWFKFAEKFRFLHQPEVLIGSHVHSAQGSRTIVSYHKETEAFLSRCIDQLTVAELAAFTQFRSPVRTCLIITKVLTSTNYPCSAYLAIRRAFQLLPRESLLGWTGIIALFPSLCVTLVWNTCIRILKIMNQRMSLSTF